MKIFGLICFLFLSMIAGSCGSKTGEIIVEAWPDGKPKKIEYYKEENGQKIVFKQTDYYKSGIKSKEGGIKDGKKHGKWTAWYEDGTVWSVGEKVDGESEGKFLSYTVDGQLVQESFYIKGKPGGTWKFYVQGRLVKEVIYHEGQDKPEVRDILDSAPIKN